MSQRRDVGVRGTQGTFTDRGALHSVSLGESRRRARAIRADRRADELLHKDQDHRVVVDRNCLRRWWILPFSLGGSVLSKFDEVGPRLQFMTNQVSRSAFDRTFSVSIL